MPNAEYHDIVAAEVETMQQSVEAFWASFENEIGEKVIAKTMCQYFATSKDRGDWGLLVLTPTSVRFRKTPGENWFASLFKASSSLAPHKAEDDLVIPFSSISGLSSPPRKFLDFLFGSPFVIFTILFGQGESAASARFAIDPKCDILAELKKATNLPA